MNYTTTATITAATAVANTVERRLSELIGTSNSSDNR